MEEGGGREEPLRTAVSGVALLPGCILMMPILICALQSLLLSQVCISPSQLFFTSLKNREKDKVGAETCSPALD